MQLTSAGERIAPTWDCGYAKPDCRMEYTGTSFSNNIVDFFRVLLRPIRKINRPQGIFPDEASLEESIPDGGISGFWKHIFNAAGKIADKVHFLQSGSLHFYLLVIVLALIAMLSIAVLRGI